MNKKYEQSLILNGLKSGLSFELLCQYYDLEYDSLDTYLKKQNKRIFKHLNAETQLEFIVEVDKLNSTIFQSIKKHLTYPLFLMLMGVMLTIVYKVLFVPNIVSMLKDFGYQESYMVKFGELMYSILLIFLSIMIVLCLFCLNKTIRFLIYIRFHNFKIMSLLKEILTIRFVFCYDFLLSKGHPAKSIIKYLRSMKGFEDVRWLTYHIHQDLDNGKPLDESIDLPYIDFICVQMFKQGYLNNTLISSLSEYIHFGMNQIELKLKRWGQTLKLLSYMYIMIYIGLFYSLLFKPLQMLEGLI
ncbi:MAG TPA: type II secretion system F family protein [Erysipelothrix sp.]|nr:type II secretion system F family protein [Erysipelothrix sp.]